MAKPETPTTRRTSAKPSEPTLFDQAPKPPRQRGKRSREKTPPTDVAPAQSHAAPTPPPADRRLGDAYERHREAMAIRSRQQSEQRREIGPLPPVANPERRAKALRSIEDFERTYLSHIFKWPIADRHRAAHKRLEEVIEIGGKYALAMPRFDGKTQHGVAAMLYAALSAKRKYIVTIAATKPNADAVRDGVRRELEGNRLLLEDFPEVCYPIVALKGQANRVGGQTLDGQRTQIEWSDERLILPTVAGSACSGICLEAKGMTGAIRGIWFKRADGTVARPDFIVLDDPQTDESARSPSQCTTRLTLIHDTIEYLGSFERTLAMVALVTVICENDVADELLNRERCPEWRGERYPLLVKFPKNLAMWEQYREMQKDELKAGGLGFVRANEFYLANRAAMDEGADVPWEHRYLRDGGREHSAIQNAMNLFLKNPEGFEAEMQQRPRRASAQEERALNADELVQRLSGIERGIVPAWATKLTAFVDIGEHVLAWAVCAWKDGFSGTLVDFGTWPRQPTHHWSKESIPLPIEKVYPLMSREARWYAALDELSAHILKRPWRRSSGDEQNVDMMLIDAGFGDSTETVDTWCLQSGHVNRVMPSHGSYQGASASQMRDWNLRAGETRGRDWIRRRNPGKRMLPYLTFATNAWKSFVADRFRTPMASAGSLTLCGERETDRTALRIVAEHMTAEYAVRVTARGRTLDEWRKKVGRDNEYLDCIVGCAVAANVVGIDMHHGNGPAAPPPRQRMSDLQRGKRR